MKAITLTQPWGTLMAQGSKTIETRSWGCLYRGPLAIHAGKSLPAYARMIGEDMHDFPSDFHGVEVAPVTELPRGVVLAVCRLVAIVPTELVEQDDLDREGQFGDYSPGRYAWKTDALVKLPEPIPATGFLSLWEWDVPFEVQRFLASLNWPPGVLYG